MKTYEEVKKELNNVIDPGYNQKLSDVLGLKEVQIGPNGQIKVKIALENKAKHELVVKREVLKILKMEMGFPGAKLEFVDNDYFVKKKLKHIIVTSGKGGVGKSTVALNLARSLTKKGLRIGILDADVHGASIANLLNLTNPVLEEDENELILPAVCEGIEVISTSFFIEEDRALLWRAPIINQLVQHYFEGIKWADDLDYLIIDTPPGTGDVLMEISKYVPKAKILIVTTPQLDAAKIALKVGSAVQKMEHEILGIVENMSYYLNPVSGERDYVFGCGGAEYISTRLNEDVLGEIPLSSNCLEIEKHVDIISEKILIIY